MDRLYDDYRVNTTDRGMSIILKYIINVEIEILIVFMKMRTSLSSQQLAYARN